MFSMISEACFLGGLFCPPSPKKELSVYLVHIFSIDSPSDNIRCGENAATELFKIFERL